MKPFKKIRRTVLSHKRGGLTRLATALGLPLLLTGALFAIVTVDAIGVRTSKVGTAIAAGAVPSNSIEDCDAVTNIPSSECLALASLFTQTKGTKWLDNSNWLTVNETISPCDWYGVGCAGGHVTELVLNNNGLGGTLPSSLADLPFLTRLLVDRNAIGGPIGPGICNLVDTLQQVDLDYNRLSASGNRSRTCLDQLDPGWSATQTVAPSGLTVDSMTGSALTLSWTPIEYVGDGGYYTIGFSTKADGPYTVHGTTANKEASSYLVDGLDPGRTYYVRVRTYTPAHDGQPNDLVSDYVSVAAVTTAPRSILLAVYFGADNDLDSYARIIQGRLVRGTLNNPNLTVVALIDRLGEENTQVWTAANGVATVDSGFLAALNSSEVDTSDPEILSDFLDYAKGLVKADVTIASIIGHGVGLAPELTEFVEGGETIAAASANQGIPALPRQKDHTPTDVTNRSYMSTPELGRALAAATDNGADPFDLIFFDQCFAGNLDVLYEVRSAAKGLCRLSQLCLVGGALFALHCRVQPSTLRGADGRRHH